MIISLLALLLVSAFFALGLAMILKPAWMTQQLARRNRNSDPNYEFVSKTIDRTPVGGLLEGFAGKKSKELMDSAAADPNDEPLLVSLIWCMGWLFCTASGLILAAFIAIAAAG